MTSPSPEKKPHLVIVGCGFGGLETARALHGKDIEITVIERTNHHLFQPLLYQVATGGLTAPSIAAPVRALFKEFPNVRTVMDEVTRIWPDTREVEVKDGSRIAYDHLVVAAGSTHSYFGNDSWAAHAPGLKTLADAFDIRRRLLMTFEAAEKESDPERQRALMNLVVIGAGPTGVELAGTMVEIARHTLAGEFRRIDPAKAEVLLIEGGPRVLQAMPDVLSEKARLQLEKLGVVVRLNTQVTGIDDSGLDVKAPAADGSTRHYRIDSRCVVWAAGVGASPLGRMLAETTGAECDRSGRVIVEPDLSIAHYPEISVVGDLACAQSHAKGKAPTPVPGVSPGAKQMGRTVARNILHRIAGQPTEKFHYADYGNLATIGRNAAVVDLATPLGALRMSGRIAWQFWLFAHIYFLIGFRNRLIVLMDWSAAHRSFQRNARVVAEPTED